MYACGPTRVCVCVCVCVCVTMPRYATDAQLQEFKHLCKHVDNLLRVHRGLPLNIYQDQKRKDLLEFKVFVGKLHVTNVSSLLSCVTKGGFSTALAEQLKSMRSQKNREDVDGNTVLHIAVLNQDEPEVKRLLYHTDGVDCDATNLEGETALHIAAKTAQWETVRDLLSFGANLFEMNDGISQHKSDSVLCVLEDWMFYRPEDEKTPVLEDIKNMLEGVEDIVRYRVAARHQDAIADNRVALFSGLFTRLGDDHSPLHQFNTELIETILTAAYPSGVGMVNPVILKQIIEDAFWIYEGEVYG